MHSGLSDQDRDCRALEVLTAAMLPRAHGKCRLVAAEACRGRVPITSAGDSDARSQQTPLPCAGAWKVRVSVTHRSALLTHRDAVVVCFWHILAASGRLLIINSAGSLGLCHMPVMVVSLLPV